MHRGRFFGFWALLGVVLTGGASAETAYTTNTVNMRAGPSREYPVVTRLGGGTPVEVAGCIDDWSWCDVIAGPDRGWVYAGNLEYPYESRRVPIIRYGRDVGLPIVVFSAGPYWDTYYRGRPWYGRRQYWVNRPVIMHGPAVVHPGARSLGPRPLGPRPAVVERSRPVNRPHVDHGRPVERSRADTPRHVERSRPQPHSGGSHPDRKRPPGGGR